MNPQKPSPLKNKEINYMTGIAKDPTPKVPRLQYEMVAANSGDMPYDVIVLTNIPNNQHTTKYLQPILNPITPRIKLPFLLNNIFFILPTTSRGFLEVIDSSGINMYRGCLYNQATEVQIC